MVCVCVCVCVYNSVKTKCERFVLNALISGKCVPCDLKCRSFPVEKVLWRN